MSLRLSRPSFMGNGQALWSGQLQVVNPTGLSLIAVTQAGISFGNTTDNSPVNFVGHGTVSSNGPVVLSPTSVVTALTINGAALTNTIQIFSSNGTSGTTDIVVSRNGSTANILAVGPSFQLADSITGTSTLWQQSGGQTELWQRTASAWAQILFVNVNRRVTINPPSSGDAALITGVAGGNTLVLGGSGTAGQSFGLLIQAGTNATDRALLVQNAAGNTNYLLIRGDGSGTLGPNGSLGLSWATTGALLIAAPASGTTALTINGASNQYGLQIQGSGTASQSFGAHIVAGTNNSDFAFVVTNAAANTNYFLVRGDGVVFGNDGLSNIFELGYKDTPPNVQAGNYTLVVADRGKTINVAGGATITLPSGVFSAGAVVSFIIGSSNTATLAQGAGLTLEWAGNGTATGNRTFTGAGLASVYFASSAIGIISGAGLS